MRASGDATPTPAKRVALFVTYLDELPLRRWLEATHTHHGDPRLAQAHAALRDALNAHASAEDVFAARNAVLLSLQRFDSAEGRWLMRGRGSTQDLRPRTEGAALAVLAHEHLAADHFAVLYGGFEALIPIALLFGIDNTTT